MKRVLLIIDYDETKIKDKSNLPYQQVPLWNTLKRLLKKINGKCRFSIERTENFKLNRTNIEWIKNFME